MSSSLNFVDVCSMLPVAMVSIVPGASLDNGADGRASTGDAISERPFLGALHYATDVSGNGFFWQSSTCNARL